MTAEGWRVLVLEAVSRSENDDQDLLNLLSRLLAEQDSAKDALRRKGYGCTGTPWAETVDEVPQADDSR